MISKADVLNALIKECQLCKRLYTKLPPDALDYRPSTGQRSTRELLSYLSTQTAGFAHSLYEGDWIWWSAAREKAKDLPIEKFPAAMDRQIQALQDLFASISDDEFARKKVSGMPWDTDKSLGVELMEHCLGFATGYRMQLFLYAKAAGATELHTGDCWFMTEDEGEQESAGD